MPAWIEEYESLLKAATPGPWFAMDYDFEDGMTVLSEIVNKDIAVNVFWGGCRIHRRKP